MSALSVMITLWGIAVAAFAVLMIYRSYLTQHETDQLFLVGNDVADFNHANNDAIVRRVGALCPYCKVLGGVAAVMTVAITGVYVYQALPYVQFQF